MLKSLNVAQSGLSAAKIAVENVSNNIANENTPGYKKRVVQLSEMDLNDSRFTGRGVMATGAYRITSEYMFNNIMRENTRNNYYEEVSFMVGSIEQMFQETDTSGFSKDLNRFFQAVENLRANPNSEVYKTTMRNEGIVLVDSLQSLYSAIEAQENITHERLDDNVDQINKLLHDIGEVNEKLSLQNVASDDLLDKRDQLEMELSNLIDIEVIRNERDYQLKIGGEVAVRHNTNIRDVNLVEEKTTQVDRFSTLNGSGVQVDNITHSLASEGLALDADDIITYKFDNKYEVSVQIGTDLEDANGDPVDLDPNTAGVQSEITADNYIRALKYEINHHTYISEKVDAFNGNYETNASGDKEDITDSDKFLLVESRVDGTDGAFEGRISVTKMTGTTIDNRDAIFKDDYQSVDAVDKVYLAVYDSEINIKSGIVKAQVDNLSSDSPNNKIVDYKNKLDEFARSLSDIYDKYVEENGEYTYGHVTTDSYEGSESINHLNLFTGSSVMTLEFNESSVTNLKQVDLDYLSKMQWKSDIDFDGFAQDGSTEAKTSFSEFFQELRVNISSDKENNDFLQKTQETVVTSLQNSYDQLTKVDKDEEMVNLIQFQAAYTANAKIITVVDEMLQTLLNIR